MSQNRGPLVVVALAALLAGCATNGALMPTPALYVGPNARPLFAEALDSRPTPIDLLFITNRASAEQPGGVPYTGDRSRSMAFGSATIEFGEDLSWPALVKESTATRRMPMRLRLGATTELGRFPPIPYAVTVEADGVRRVPSVVAAHQQAKHRLQEEVARRLALAARKEVVLYVHGYNTGFEHAALTMGQLCHFLGREFTCGIFTWPSGARRGLMFGYDFDRESSEYAVGDLVKAIRIVARAPGVERLHLIAHSRGTDTLASALAELGAEAYALRSSLDREFRIGRVVLVAPDLDGDVALAKIFKVFSDPDLPFGDSPDSTAVIPPSPGLTVTCYVSPDDKAIATAAWMFGSMARLGRIDTSTLAPEQIEAIAMLRVVDFVQVDGTTDFFGHNYFISNPRVSADIIALLRYDLRPNEPGRPLERIAGPFWRVPARRPGGRAGHRASARRSRFLERLLDHGHQRAHRLGGPAEVAAGRAALRDGTIVGVRPIRPDDKSRLATAFAHLSPDSVYRRFLHPVGGLTPADLRYLTEIDFRDHVAIVLTVEEAGAERLIAVGRFVREAPGGASAEVAMTVADDFQHRGAGTLLMQRLVELARVVEVRRFIANVLPDNAAMIALIERSGLPYRHEADVEVCRFTLNLGQPDASGVARALERCSGIASSAWKALKSRAVRE